MFQYYKNSRYKVVLGALLAGVSALLLGCETNQQSAPVLVIPTEPSYSDVAEQLCSVGGLSQQYALMRTQYEEIERDPRWHSAVTGQAQTRHQVEQRYNRDPIDSTQEAGVLSERISLSRILELDIDASYRLAVSACQAHAYCIQTRDTHASRSSGSGDQCQGELENWSSAQERFSDVSLELASVRAELARIATPVPVVVVPPTRPTPERPHSSCRDYISGVFTTSACNRN